LTYNIINRWVAVSAVVAAIDFAGTVAFGVDYDRVKVTQPEYPRRYTEQATGSKKTKNRSLNTEVENFLFATVLRTTVVTRQLINKRVRGFIPREVGGGLPLPH